MNAQKVNEELRKARNALASLDMEEYAAAAAMVATQKKIQFEAYKKAGFTEEQAIQLCK